MPTNKDTLQLLESLMEKYNAIALKNEPTQGNPNYFHGVVDGLNNASKALQGISDDYMGGVEAPRGYFKNTD